MECAVVVTQRCNARCQMCNSWQYPSAKAEEFLPQILESLPGGMQRLNITGGEPMLRDDIEDIVRLLDKKTGRLEISTNGYFSEKLVKLAEKFPNITVRVSIEGLPRINDEIRGLKHGFDHALRTIGRLKALGVKDIGFATVISDKNISDLLDIYRLCSDMDIEFANATLHNSFYFQKYDNKIENPDSVIAGLQEFIQALLQSRRSNLRRRLKDWGRAYLNLGLRDYLLAKSRPLPCGAGTDTFFVSPRGEIWACNGSREPWVMGNLQEQSFAELWSSPQAEAVRAKVKNCQQNCWMTGTAVPAMRKNFWVPLKWVLKNKLRLALGKGISFC